MTHADDFPTPDRLRAHLARGRLWLMEILAWLGALFGARIGRVVRAEVRSDLQRLRRTVGAALVLLAAHRRAPSLRRPPRPPNAPRGFRRGRFCPPLRGATRLLKPGRGLAGRIGALTRVLDDLDAWIVRMRARLQREVFVCAYVMVRVPAEPCAAVAGVAPRPADTS